LILLIILVVATPVDFKSPPENEKRKRVQTTLWIVEFN